MTNILDNLIFIDIEQPNSDQCFICQIATIQYDPTTSENIVIDELVNPYVKFEHFNKKLHGINEGKIFDKPNFKQAFLDKIDIHNDKYIWVGHNIKNDLKVISCDAYRYNERISKIKYICTQELFKKELGRQQGNSVNELCKEFLNVELKNCHNAYYDALACKDLFEFITKEYEMKKPIESYIESFTPNISLADIKSGPYISELHILKIAISINVYTELKLNSMDVESKLNDLKYEFHYLIEISKNEFKDSDYETFIKNTTYNKKTINMIYLQILLSYFAFKDIITPEETNYILKWINSLDEDLKYIYPFDIFVNKSYKKSKSKTITNEESNEIILLLNQNELYVNKKPNSNIIESNNEISSINIDGFKFHEINSKNKIFDKLINNNDDLSNKKFCLTGNFKSDPSKYLKEKFKMTEQKEVTGSATFLIIGSLGDSKWICEFSKKVAKAIENNIKIISEEELNLLLPNSK